MFTIIQAIIIMLGTLLGFTTGYYLVIQNPEYHNILGEKSELYLSLILGGLGYLITSILTRDFKNWFEKILPQIKIKSFVAGTFGFFVGLLIMNAISIFPLLMFFNSKFFTESTNPLIMAIVPILRFFIPISLNLIGGYIGMTFMLKKDVVSELFHHQTENIKILDTSVIIDGRIYDICKTRFLEGTLIIPNFVLAELQFIADSSDPIKRQKGRRGLDVLNKLRTETEVNIEISKIDFPSIKEVDAKLIELARKLNAKLITTDLNLSKIARLEGVATLNVNDLSNAIKPLVVPGEKLRIKVIKPGKEQDQGIGYLSDGTMIVLENGAKYVGQEVDTEVTSVLQTSAGRLIFAKVEGGISNGSSC